VNFNGVECVVGEIVTKLEKGEIKSRYILKRGKGLEIECRYNDTYRGDGINLYAYCYNNPVMYYDPSGYSKVNCLKNVIRQALENGNGKNSDVGGIQRGVQR
jgi:hypothetical protein